ncbi:MAG: methyltransferase domain-containing protein [Sediminibacterium sp.]|nr:methyltransferase domain-containing protein [Sediminibacterium sp.]
MNTPTAVPCSLCQQSARLQAANFVGYKVDMQFSIYQCDHCNTSFPLPLVNTDAIYDFIYKNGEKVPAYDRYWHYFKQVKHQPNPLAYLAAKEDAYWGIREALQQITANNPTPRILEVGCGLGYLTYSLRTAGYDVHGLDISHEAIQNARQHFGDFYICDNLFAYVHEHAASYDVIILTEVIEHVNEPIAFVKTIADLLKKGGKAIITTPNRSLIPNDIIWDTELPPVHQWWFSENSMQYIANQLQLDLHFVSFRNFYHLHPKEYIVKRGKKKSFRIPVIDEHWQFYSHVVKATTPDNTIMVEDVAAIENDSFKKQFKRALLKVKALVNPSTIICDERGNTLCAVFEKKA